MDEELLAEARRAQERLIDAERDADVARADFHRAVRRLHLHDTSLRELAGALGLSHQRVHQIVESAGGSRRWLRHRAPGDRQPGRPVPRPVCTFCGKEKTQDAKVVAGPHVYICDACVPLAQHAISSRPAPGGPFLPVFMTSQGAQPECEPRVRLACSFCGKQVHQVAALAMSAAPAAPDPASPGFRPRAVICSECLDLCDEIFAEDPPDRKPPGPGSA